MDYVLIFGLGAFVGYLLSRSRGSSEAAESHAARVVNGPGTYSVNVVGESHYQDALEEICGGRAPGGVMTFTSATLVLEDSNPYDDQAVRVDISGRTVGYLSKSNARTYRKWLEGSENGAEPLKCEATITGGWDRGNGDRGSFGVKLDLPA